MRLLGELIGLAIRWLIISAIVLGGGLFISVYFFRPVDDADCVFITLAGAPAHHCTRIYRWFGI